MAQGADFNGRIGFPIAREKNQIFGWDHSHTHRIEGPSKAAAYSFHINEHCVLVFFSLAIRRLRYISEKNSVWRGDLFRAHARCAGT